MAGMVWGRTPVDNALADITIQWCVTVRPPLNKVLFPVDCPSGFKRGDWNFFPYFQKIVFFFTNKFFSLK